MPMIRRGDCDSVDILLLKHFAKVLLGNRSLAGFLLRFVGKFLQDRRIDVADMRNACGTAIDFEGGQMSVSAAVQTDNCKVDTIIRAKNLAIAFGGRSDGHAGSASREHVKKFTPCDHSFLLR